MLRSFFISLSTNQTVRSLMENSWAGKRLSSRFVAGMQMAEAIETTKALNRKGLSVTLDALGENVDTAQQARQSGDLYKKMLDAIAAEGLDANVSLKLTQMGMDLSPELAEEIVGELVELAASQKNFVRIDMEGTPYTSATIAMTERLHARPGCTGAVGTVLQAYLYRTAQDTNALLDQGIRIRLCKGAYKEDATHAFQEKSDVDKNYVKLMQRMTSSGVFCGIATHDEAMITATRRWVMDEGIRRDAFEFQMLYGIRRDLQEKLVEAGFRVRVYVPFGTEWYPYFMRRLAERPANAIFIAKQLLRT